MPPAEQVLFDELNRHHHLTGQFFNIRCSCGYRGTTVSQVDDWLTHVATELAKAGFRKVDHG